MKKIQAWVEKTLVPITNKLTKMYWFSILTEAVLFIVPLSMVSSIPSVVNILRRFIPAIPNLSPISDFSFGIVGLLMAYIIPHSAMVKEGRADRSVMAGFTAVGTYMLCMKPEAVEGGRLFVFEKFGAGGMFTAMAIGLMVGIIYKEMLKHSFFNEDSSLPDFIQSWFDNIINILLCLLIGWLFTYVLSVDVFTLIGLIMSPITSFAQSLPGVIFITVVMDVFYFFGVSGWVFVPVVGAITRAALAENAALVAAGAAATNIYAFGFSKYYMLGGQAATLALAIMLLFAKSRRYKVIGKATIVPSLFNINEPLVFGCIVNNPFMFLPVVINAVALPTIAYLWIYFGVGGAVANYMNFDMQFAPCVVQTYMFTGGNLSNCVLSLICLAVSAIVWLPFFKVADRYELNKEAGKDKK